MLLVRLIVRTPVYKQIHSILMVRNASVMFPFVEFYVYALLVCEELEDW